MVFNDVSGGTGIIQECERICNLGAQGIAANAQKLSDFTARINNALDRFYALAFQKDTLWNFDSKTQTDLPIATTNLVSAQQGYSFASDLLVISQLFVKDQNGIYQELGEQDDKGDPEAYLLKQDNGTPTKYELVGNSILLSPIPSYNSTNGLKIVYKRIGAKFSPNDGGATVGIPVLFHPYLARQASYPYVMEKGLRHVNLLQQEILKDELAITNFIANRAKPKRAGLRVVNENTR